MDRHGRRRATRACAIAAAALSALAAPAHAAFGPALDVPGAAANDAASAVVASAANGDAVIGWQSPGSESMIATRTAGVWRVLPSGLGSAPQVAIDARGDIVAAAVQAGRVCVRYRQAGGTAWIPADAPQCLGLGTDRPSVALNSAGSAIVAWYDAGAAQRAYAALRPAGSGAWEAPQEVAGTVVRSAGQPPASAAIDDAGNAIVAYSTLYDDFRAVGGGEGLLAGIQTSRRGAGAATWAQPDDVTPRPAVDFEQPGSVPSAAGARIAADPVSGQLVGTWSGAYSAAVPNFIAAGYWRFNSAGIDAIIARGSVADGLVADGFGVHGGLFGVAAAPGHVAAAGVRVNEAGLWTAVLGTAPSGQYPLLGSASAPQSTAPGDLSEFSSPAIGADGTAASVIVRKVYLNNPTGPPTGPLEPLGPGVRIDGVAVDCLGDVLAVGGAAASGTLRYAEQPGSAITANCPAQASALATKVVKTPAASAALSAAAVTIGARPATRSGRVRLSVRCPPAARTRCRVVLTLTAGKPAVVLGRASATIASGRSKVVTVVLTRAGRAAARGRRTLGATATVRVTDGGGRTVTARRAVRLALR